MATRFIKNEARRTTKWGFQRQSNPKEGNKTISIAFPIANKRGCHYQTFSKQHIADVRFVLGDIMELPAALEDFIFYYLSVLAYGYNIKSKCFKIISD